MVQKVLTKANRYKIKIFLISKNRRPRGKRNSTIIGVQNINFKFNVDNFRELHSGITTDNMSFSIHKVSEPRKVKEELDYIMSNHFRKENYTVNYDKSYFRVTFTPALYLDDVIKNEDKPIFNLQMPEISVFLNLLQSQLDDLLMDTVVKHIGRNGIRFLKADYFNDALYGIREKCIIKYSLNDLSYIKIYSIKGEFLCRANRVTATHPLAHLLGNVKDIEDYKQKIRKQKQLQNKTLKAVKEHFSLEDIDLIKSKLLEAEIVSEEIPVIEKQEIKKEKEKDPENYVQNRKRPIFKDNYERYEWHI